MPKLKSSFSQELIDQIKSSVNILDIVGEHVVLRKSGSNYGGLCPFHAERTPSFSVSETKQLYHCYGCKKGGDLVSFVMEIAGLSFPEAVKELAERAGLSQKLAGHEWGKEDSEKRKKVNLAFRLNRFVAAFFRGSLQQKHEDYLKERKVSSELSKLYYVGAAEDSWDALSHHLKNSKAPMEVAVELGLIRPSQKKERLGGIEFFDLFRNRLIFPILNSRGKVVAFGGRLLPGVEKSGTSSQPKYLNSPDSVVFQKSKVLYGLYQAQKYIREKDAAIVVEGYFDVMALQSIGIHHVVSTCGTSLTSEHLKRLDRLCSKVIVLFDGDSAGKAAAIRAMELGLDLGKIIYGIVPPDGTDPDEWINKNSAKDGFSEGLRTQLENAKPLIDQEIETAIVSAHQDPESKVKALKRIGLLLQRLKDPVGREVRLDWVESRLGVRRSLLLAPSAKLETRKSVVPKSEPQVSAVLKTLPASKPLSTVDRTLLSGLVSGMEQASAFFEISDQLPPHSKILEIFDSQIAQDYFLNHFGSFVERFRTTTERQILLKPTLKEFLKDPLRSEVNPEIRSLIAGAVMKEPMEISGFKRILLKRVEQVWARFSHRLKAALHEAESQKDTQKHHELMKEYLDVRRKMKEFSNFYGQE